MGILNVLKTIGKTSLKVVDCAGDILNHPAVVPLTLMVPWGWAQAAILIVRKVDKMAEELEAETGLVMNSQQKQAAFAAKMKAQFPEASNGDLQALAALLVKVNRGEVEE